MSDPEAIDSRCDLTEVYQRNTLLPVHATHGGSGISMAEASLIFEKVMSELPDRPELTDLPGTGTFQTKCGAIVQHSESFTRDGQPMKCYDWEHPDGNRGGIKQHEEWTTGELKPSVQSCSYYIPPSGTGVDIIQMRGYRVIKASPSEGGKTIESFKPASYEIESIILNKADVPYIPKPQDSVNLETNSQPVSNYHEDGVEVMTSYITRRDPSTGQFQDLAVVMVIGTDDDVDCARYEIPADFDPNSATEGDNITTTGFVDLV